MSRNKIIILVMLSIWAISMWAMTFKKAVTPIEIDLTLSDDFKEWEVRSRLLLIDTIIDDVTMAKVRQHWHTNTIDLQSFAKMVIDIQNNAYGFRNISLPRIHFVTLRGDANGLYIPQDQTIYINSKMHWSDLPFERFVSVVLHENMHHIMTQGLDYFDDKNHSLYSDFVMLAHVAYLAQNGLADNIVQGHSNDNPQEWIAYRAQRASRFAGVLHSNLPSWDMSNRINELDILRGDAKY